jgi:hypothetical protein
MANNAMQIDSDSRHAPHSGYTEQRPRHQSKRNCPNLEHQLACVTGLGFIAFADMIIKEI